MLPLLGLKRISSPRLWSATSRRFTPLITRNQSQISDSVIELMNKNKKRSDKLKEFDFDSILKRNNRSKSFQFQMKDVVQDFKSQVELMPITRFKNSIEVNVKNQSSLASDLRALHGLVARNKINSTVREQRFYIRPGRKRRLARSRKHRQLFLAGFKNLIGLVKDARRKGY